MTDPRASTFSSLRAAKTGRKPNAQLPKVDRFRSETVRKPMPKRYKAIKKRTPKTQLEMGATSLRWSTAIGPSLIDEVNALKKQARDRRSNSCFLRDLIVEWVRRQKGLEV